MAESEDAEVTTMSMDECDEFIDTVEEDPTNRYDACRWLRKIVGVVAARDLPAEASIEAFREALKSGIILCNVINKIQPGLVRKVVKAPSAVFTTPDAAAQSAYSENIRNFLIAIEELGLPTFEPSDIEPGGDFSRVVNTLLVLKTYSESGSRKSSWISKASQSGKSFARRNSEPTISRSQSASEKSFNTTDQYGDGNESNEERDSGSLYMIVCDLLEDREEEDIPIIVENILNRVKEEFECRLSVHSTIEPSKEVTKSKEKDESNEKKEEASMMTKKEEADREADRVKKEQERIDREKKEKLALQEKAKKQEEELIKEEERIKRERELLTKQELARKQQEEEAEKAAKEQERIKREKELLAQQEMAKKQEEEHIRREEERKRIEEEHKRIEEERIRKEEELLAQQEMAKKQEEERIRREEELSAQQEMAKKEEEERIKREEELRVQREKAERKEEKRRKKEETRIAREQERLKREEEIRARREEAKRQAEERKREKREQKEKAKREKQERIKKERELRIQKERERREQERIQRQKELFATHEKAKQAELSALEVERKNKEREFLEEEEKIKREEEELERIERDAEEERTRKKEEYKIRKDEYSKVNIDTTKRKEVLGQEDKELQELRNTISSAKTDVRSMQTNCQEEADNLGTHVHTLCQAAAGYKKVLEENRKLYNQVQDLKGSIRVYCRVRPFLPGQENNVTSVDYMDDETVTIIVPSKSGNMGRKASMFNKVFGPSATQEDVFSDTGPLIRSVLDGFNVCIFACGQTGSGKTYTLTGPDDLTQETMGVNFRALTDLFSISEERKNLVSYEISINMVEIYNDEIRDLLVTDGTSKILDITNGTKKGINLPEANLVRVSSIDDVINLMNLCKKNRAGNDHSSRSHSFVTVHVFGKDITVGTTTRGCMHVVDLAGSEKVDTSVNEATHVNKSLSALGDILVALANKSTRVPYKACKLTQLLQDAIGAQSKILMFVHVHPDIDEAGETLSTFKFVERFSTVEGGCGKSPEVRELKEQICYLKAALAKKKSGDSSWQDLATSSPKGGDGEDSSNPKPPTKSPSLKKLTPGAVAAAKSKQATTADSKKKKGK